MEKRTQFLLLTGRQAYIMHFFIAILMVVFQIGCSDEIGEQKKEKSIYTEPDGVFIVNEGQYMAGNGSISFYKSTDKTVSNHLFYSVNGRSPGDIPQFLAFKDETAYLVVNNSNFIEVIDLKDFKNVATITGLDMPRQISVHNDQAFVTQIGSSDIAVIDLNENRVVKTIQGLKSSDHILRSGNKLFVANWTSFYINKPNNTIMVYDTETLSLIDSIVVTKEPNSMVIDSQQRIWVLSSGGFMEEEYPALTCIDPNTLSIVKTLEFPSKSLYPSLLTISFDGSTLYYVDHDIFSLSVNDIELPSNVFIGAAGRSIYGLDVDPVNGEIYVADAKDFQQDGEIFRYSSSGQLIDNFTVGINPSGFFFYRR